MLPGLRYVVSHGKAPDKMIAAYLKVMERLNARLDTIDALTKPK